MSNNNRKATITEQRIKSPKIWVLICAIVALLSDIAVLTVLLINSSEFKFWICPLIILVFDAIFIVKVVLSNYRFSYAFKDMVVHVLLVMLASVAAAVSTGYLETRIVFEDLAFYALPAIHFIQCIAIFFTALFASRKKKTFYSVATVVFTVFFAACASAYGYFLFDVGFFGQGFYTENRTIVYELNKETNEYIVKGVLKGFGTNVDIPKEFNGRPVGGIDCDLFTNKSIKSVELNCDTDVKFENTEALKELNTELAVLSASENMDDFRRAIYALATKEKQDPMNLGNIIAPNNLAGDQVYLAFNYTYDDLQLLGGKIIPTWIGNKTEVFNLKEHAGDTVPYIEHSDVTSEADLYFCYKNQDGKIFRLSASNGNDKVDGFKHEVSSNIQVTFDKIYVLDIEKDNDTKYDTLDNNRFLDVSDVENHPKLATADNIQNVLDTLFGTLPERKGFTFAWYVGAGSNKHVLTNVADEIASIGNGDTLKVYPEWQLKAPVINSLTVNSASENASVVYGNIAQFDFSATSPDTSISLRYELTHSSLAAPKEGEHIAIENWKPANKGTYTLTVTAYSDELTSLDSKVAQTIEVGFEKKLLNFAWTLPENTVYSATEKDVSATARENQIINNDKITFELVHDTIKNVGTYPITLKLTEDADTKYYVAASDATNSVTITPYVIETIDWAEGTHVFDGTYWAPSATFKGLERDGTITLSITGQQRNAGKNYTATATNTNNNYTLKTNTTTFEITRKPITIATWDKNTFVYNGYAQNSVVATVVGAVEGEDSLVIGQMTYDGTGTNVGQYYITTAQLPDTSNYMLSGEVSNTFDITKKALIVTVNSETMIYKGSAYVYQDFSFTNDGLVGNDKISEVLTLNYRGEAVDAVNVRKEAYTIEADANPLEKYDNYEIEIIPGTLTIEKKQLDIYITDAEKIYDGLVYTEFTFTNDAMPDAISDIFELTFTGSAVTATNYLKDGYTISASTTPGEKSGNYNVIVHDATLMINKAPLRVEAIGGGKTYDGYVGDGFTINVTGLVNNETVESLGAPVYTGAAKNNKNVGEHVLDVFFNNNNVTSNYDITYVEGLYVIRPKDLTITANNSNKVYDGVAGGRFDFTADGLVETDSKGMLGTPAYSGAATTEKNVGTYTLTVKLPDTTAAKNYNITYIDGDFEITKKNITVTATSSSKTYDAKEGGTFNFTVSGLIEGENKSILGEPRYGGEATEAINVGAYKLSVALDGNANYEIVSYVEGTFTITQKEITITPSAPNRTYDGVTAGGNFTFSTTPLAGNETADLFGVPTYNNNATTAINAGSYTIGITFPAYPESGNYKLICNYGTFKIDKKDLHIIVNSGHKTYDGQTVNVSQFDFVAPELAVSDTKESLGTPTYTCGATTNKNVGTYPLSVTLPSNTVTNNYNITYESAAYTIEQKTLTITALNGTKVYDGMNASNFDFSVDGLVSGEYKADLGTPTYTGDAPANKNVDTYTFSLVLPNNTVTNNYDIHYVGAEYTITKKDLTVSANNAGKVYNGLVANNSEFSFTATGLAYGDTQSMLGTPAYNCAATKNKNVGEYDISFILHENTTTKNYNIIYEYAKYNITKKALTVTADNKNITYGQPASGFSFTVTGLATGDTKDKLGTAIYTSDAIANTDVEAGTYANVGSYVLEVSLPANEVTNNYEISYNNGRVVIGKKNLTITVGSIIRPYNGNVANVSEFNYTAEGLVGNDNLGEPTYTCGALTNKNAGTYNITVKFSDTTVANNYNITCKGTYTIEKVKLTVTAIGGTKVSDGKPASKEDFSFKAEGFVGTDSVEDVTAEYTCDALTSAEAKEYTLSVVLKNKEGMETLNNYEITYIDGTFVISPASTTPEVSD